MRILVLGGTAWLGHLVATEAVARGHDVFCLARGEAGAVPQGATLIPADRRSPSAYDALAGFDAAVEVSWQPTFVRDAVRRVRARHWVYVSSGSAYAPGAPASAGTAGPLREPWRREGEAPLDAYGEAKVACEQLIASTPSSLIARAGLIGGYGDGTDRLGYWPARMALATGDRRRVLLPDAGEAPAQVIDVGDLARWLVHCAAHGIPGTYDAVGPRSTFGQVVDASVAVAGTSPEPVWASEEFLLGQGVRPFMGPESLPLWLGGASPPDFLGRDPTAAQQAGLELRPLADTLAAALRWERELGLERPRKAGLSPAREQELLDALAL
jgi:nucleoside-diphosphate-sugar epimerase